jgi:hypothetical protein
MSFRSFLYALAKGLGDASAVKRGQIGKRVARRAAGRVAGKALGKLLKGMKWY